jgi:hypothetical protein
MAAKFVVCPGFNLQQLSGEHHFLLSSLMSSVYGVTTVGARPEAVDTEDPRPPFGGVDWQRLGGSSSLLRGVLSLQAALIAALPKRLILQDL